MGYVLRGGRLPDDDRRSTVLAATPRTDPAPKWPLSTPTAREKELWRDLWSYPVSLLWVREGLLPVVSLYVRKLGEAEKPGSPATLVAAVSRLADDLYLSPASRLRSRIVIATDDEQPRTPAPRQQSAPSREPATGVVRAAGPTTANDRPARPGEATDPATGRRRSSRERFARTPLPPRPPADPVDE